MENKSVLPQMPLQVLDVLRQCTDIAQELHPLAFDDELCASWTAYPKRNSALVVLELDLTAMWRKRVREHLRNALIRQGFRRLSALDDGHTMKKHGQPLLKMMMAAERALAAATDHALRCATCVRVGFRPCVGNEVAVLRVLNTRQHVTADFGVARREIAVLIALCQMTALPQSDELERTHT